MKNLITIIIMLVVAGCDKSEVEKLEAENNTEFEAYWSKIEAEKKENKRDLKQN